MTDGPDRVAGQGAARGRRSNVGVVLTLHLGPCRADEVALRVRSTAAVRSLGAA